MNKKDKEILIKEAFSKGWESSHECSTEFDFESELNNCMYYLLQNKEPSKLYCDLDFFCGYKEKGVICTYEECCKWQAK